MRRYCLVSLAAIAVVYSAYSLTDRVATRPPESLHEVAVLAERRGLYWACESPCDLEGMRLIVSRTPLSPERTDVRINNPKHPCWHGTIMVDRRIHAMMANYEAGYTVAWRGMWVAGDPDLIEYFTGIRPHSAAN